VLKKRVPQESAWALLITTEQLAALPNLLLKNELFLLFVCYQEPIREMESFDESIPGQNS
jgi:hypothetical protein